MLHRLPESATLIRTYSRYTYDQHALVTEHEYEIVVYRDKDGNILCGYFPKEDEKKVPIIESVSGRMLPPGLMAYLVFNRFFLDTLVYRETLRLF